MPRHAHALAVSVRFVVAAAAAIQQQQQHSIQAQHDCTVLAAFGAKATRPTSSARADAQPARRAGSRAPGTTKAKCSGAAAPWTMQRVARGCAGARLCTPVQAMACTTSAFRCSEAPKSLGGTRTEDDGERGAFCRCHGLVWNRPTQLAHNKPLRNACAHTHTRARQARGTQDT